MPLLPGDAGKYIESAVTSDLAGGQTYWVVRLGDQAGGRWWLGGRFSEGVPDESEVKRFATEAEAREVERRQRQGLGEEVAALPVFGLKALARLADWSDDAAEATRSFEAIAHSGGRRVVHLVGSPLGGGHVVRFRDTPGRVVVDVLRPVSGERAG